MNQVNIQDPPQEDYSSTTKVYEVVTIRGSFIANVADINSKLNGYLVDGTKILVELDFKDKNKI